MGIRRVFDVDWMRYDTHSGSSVWQTTPTYPWYTPGADVWYTTYTGGVPDQGGYTYLSAGPGADTYLIRSGTITDYSSVSVDWGVDVGSIGVDTGVYIMATSATLNQNSYRIRQNFTGNRVVLESMTGAGSAVVVGSVDYTPSHTLGSIDYYRARYYPQNFSIESGESIATTVGKFVFYAGQDYQLMSNIGSVTDPSPITTGSYNGLYHGAGVPARFYMYTRGNDWYPMLNKASCKHSLKGPSTLNMYVPRPYYDKWGTWDKQDYVQAFITDDDGTDAYEVLDFYGSVTSVRQYGPDQVNIICHTDLNLLNQNTRSHSSYSGTSDGYLKRFIETPGGENFTLASWTNDYPVTFTDLDIQTGLISYTSKSEEGTTDLDVVKHMSLVEDYYVWYTPKYQFVVGNNWRDLTTGVGSIHMDCGAMNSRFHDFDYIEDLNQMVNDAVVYRSGGTRSTAASPNTTTQGLYNERRGLYGLHINTDIADATEANAVTATLVNRHGTDTYVLDLYFLARYGQLFPGDIVKGSVPQLQIGGDYNTAHASWVPAEIAILEKEWDSESMLIRFRINATWTDDAVKKGYQHHEEYVKGLITHQQGQIRRSQANHV
jgi:hypothetical protein